MPDFDFCLIDGVEWSILAALFLGGAVAVGLLLGAIVRRIGLGSGPSVTGFGVGCILPTVFSVGLVVSLVKVLDPGAEKCGFTPDTVGLVFLFPLAPLVTMAALSWQSRRK